MLIYILNDEEPMTVSITDLHWGGWIVVSFFVYIYKLNYHTPSCLGTQGIWWIMEMVNLT